MVSTGTTDLSKRVAAHNRYKMCNLKNKRQQYCSFSSLMLLVCPRSTAALAQASISGKGEQRSASYSVITKRLPFM